MYTKKALIIRLFLSFLLSVIFYISVYFLRFEYFIFALVITALLYIFPIYVTAIIIKKRHIKKCLDFIIKDIIYQLCPAVFSTVVCEIGVIVLKGDQTLPGLFAIVLSLMYITITACGFGLYKINSLR